MQSIVWKQTKVTFWITVVFMEEGGSGNTTAFFLLIIKQSNMFKELSAIIPKGDTITISITPTSETEIAVSVMASKQVTGLAPIFIKGTFEELDENFISALKVPLQKVSAKFNIDTQKFDDSLETAEVKSAKGSKKSSGKNVPKSKSKVEKPEEEEEEVEEEETSDETTEATLVVETKTKKEAKPEAPKAPSEYEKLKDKVNEIVAKKDWIGALMLIDANLPKFKGEELKMVKDLRMDIQLKKQKALIADDVDESEEVVIPQSTKAPVKEEAIEPEASQSESTDTDDNF